MFKNGKKITKRILKRCESIWEYETREEIKKCLSTDLDFYLDDSGLLRIRENVDISNLFEIENSIMVYVYRDVSENALKYLNETYPNKTIVIEVIEGYFDDSIFSKYGFNKQNIIDENKGEYDKKFNLNHTYYYINKPTNFLETLYKKAIYWQNVDVNKIEFKKLSQDEIIKVIYKDYYQSRYAENENERNLFGFHYLGGISLDHPNKSYYIVGFYEGVIVSIISIKEYNKYLLKGTYVYLPFVSYIDVREDVKKKGVATAMIKFFNSTLSDTDLIIGTDMSEEGKKANIHGVFSRILGSKWENTFEEYYLKIKKDL